MKANGHDAGALPMRNGIFLAPFHPLDRDPTEALRSDLELIEALDRFGYEEAWIGEHHSAGFEIISSPELFIAAAAERTKSIKLGTGVVSLPYHNSADGGEPPHPTRSTYDPRKGGCSWSSALACCRRSCHDA